MKINASGGIDGSDALMGPKVQANDIKQAAEQFEAIFLRNMLNQVCFMNTCETLCKDNLYVKGSRFHGSMFTA